MRLSADTLSIPDKSSLSGVLCGSEIDRVAVHQHHYFPSQIGHPHTLECILQLAIFISHHP